jgi:hypothetical protein
MCHGEPYDEKHFAMCPCQDTRQRIPLGPTKPCRILPLTFALGPILPPHFPCGLTPPDLIPSCTWPRPPYPSPSLSRSIPPSLSRCPSLCDEGSYVGSQPLPLSYGPPWAHYLGGYQDRLLGGPLGLPDLRCTVPDGVKLKDYGGEVLG